MMQPNLENLQNSMRRITKVYENIKINDSDSRILGIPTEIPSVAEIIWNSCRSKGKIVEFSNK